jgi:CDP-diacylglycerol--glycerol-3-phosphate 3-phosphatidyltransferase
MTRTLRDEIARRAGKARLTITDGIIGRIFLPVIPRKVRPNAVTFFRFFCIPFVIYFLVTENYAWGTAVFAVAALSDAVDGAMARIRHQITTAGKFYDPLADKLLIGSAAVILISRSVNVILAAIIIALEVIVIGTAWHKKVTRPKANIQAKLPGKIKMVLQCVGVLLILLSLLTRLPYLLAAAQVTLWMAVGFAIMSAFSYNSI